MVVATGLLAAIGPVERFAGPDKLVACLGLNPSVRRSGEGRPRHGRITKQGRTHPRAGHAGRGRLASGARSGPLRAFVHQRVARRRGDHIAAVAMARKLAVIVRHLLRRGEDYAWVRRGRRSTPRSCPTSSPGGPGSRPDAAKVERPTPRT